MPRPFFLCTSSKVNNVSRMRVSMVTRLENGSSKPEESNCNCYQIKVRCGGALSIALYIIILAGMFKPNVTVSCTYDTPVIDVHDLNIALRESCFCSANHGKTAGYINCHAILHVCMVRGLTCSIQSLHVCHYFQSCLPILAIS